MEQRAPHNYHSEEHVQEEKKLQREAFDRFLQSFEINTFKGLGYGLALGLLFRRKFVFSALGAGIGSGVSLNLCADDFNHIHMRLHRLEQERLQTLAPEP